ncbi:MAG TPA: hypothetical protein VFV72_09995 [Candidatus Limnocylindrales bacterium]|nr:hypothetical protein [Candidatus Limnocylindrales bacterium]
MSDALDEVLQLVASGVLSAEEAAPVIDALQAAGVTGDRSDEDAANARPDGMTASGRGTGGRPRTLRIEVAEDGRKVVNLRVPLAIGRMGLDRIPGLSPDTTARIRQAFDEGLTGPILAVDEDGDGNGVRIVLE